MSIENLPVAKLTIAVFVGSNVLAKIGVPFDVSSKSLLLILSPFRELYNFKSDVCVNFPTTSDVGLLTLPIDAFSSVSL